ncbi:phage tail protein [Sphaerisporangium sp. NPDC004334]
MAINVGELFATIDLRDRLSPLLRRAVNNLRQAAADAGRHAGNMSLSLGRVGVAATLAAARLVVLGAAAAAVGNGVASLGAALAPAVGALAGLPAAAALAGAGLVTLALALYGVQDAFEAALGDDAAKYEAALAMLSPAAQAAARELRALKPVIDWMRFQVQDALFVPLIGQLTALVAVLLGPLQFGMTGVASAIGVAAAQVAQFARSTVAVRALITVFTSLRTIIGELTPAITPLLTGLSRLTEVGASFAVSLAPAVAAVVTRLGEFLTAAADSGRALSWMQGAVQVFLQLASIARQVWGILSGVFEAMRSAGGDALGVLGTILVRINQFVNSLQGQQTLAAVFVAMHQAALALAPVIVVLALGVGQLAPLVGALAVVLGPVLVAAVNALVPALAALAPGIYALFVAAGQVVVAVAPLLPAVASLASLLAVTLTAGLQAVLPSLGLLAAAFIQAVFAVAPVVPMLLAVAASLVSQLVPALLPLIPIATQIAGALGQLVVTGLTQLLAAVQPLLPVLSQAVATIGAALLAALVAVAPHLTSIIGAFTQLLPVIVPILPPMVQLITGILPPMVQLVDAVARLLRGDLSGALVVAGQAVVGFLAVMGNLGWELLTGLYNGIVAAGRWFRDVIYNFFRDLMPQWVRDALGIRSPSTVFAEIGVNTMLGMSAGMTASARHVLDTARGIAGQLAGAFAPELSASIGSTGVLPTGARPGGGTVINVTAINPQAEPTSDTINRGLSYAGMLGVL